MTIAISGSMSFAREMLILNNQLIEAGHTVILPHDAHEYATNPNRVEDKWQKEDHDLFRRVYHEVERCDAVLVLNLSKGTVSNYVGGFAFLEMGFAHVLKKKIFLFNPIPDLPYREEMASMQPVILNGDISRIHVKAPPK